MVRRLPAGPAICCPQQNTCFPNGSLRFPSGANAGFLPPALAAERSRIVSSFDVICLIQKIDTCSNFGEHGGEGSAQHGIHFENS